MLFRSKKMEAYFEDPFVVVYGDVLTDLDLGALMAFHRTRQGGMHATLTLDQRPDAAQCGVAVVDTDDRIRDFMEKPQPDNVRSPWVNSGIMILDRPLLEWIPPNRASDFGRDVFPDWLSRGIPLFGWRLPEEVRVMDMGTPDRYERANREWGTCRSSLRREGH